MNDGIDSLGGKMGHIGMEKVYIVGGKRTPFGSFGGSLGQIEPSDLCYHSAKSMLDDLGLKPELIDQVIVANVIPSTPATLYTARHLALKLGMRIQTPALMLNRLCGSGIEAIIQAKRLINNKEADCVLVSGVENMSLIPHLTYGARFGTKYGGLKTRDFLLDTLTDELSMTPMGITAENLATEYSIDRSEVDLYSLNSHHKAFTNRELLRNEIAPIEIKGKIIQDDEHIRMDAKIEEISKLKPTFKKDGVVTAASASGIVDGAASVIVASHEFIKKHNLKPVTTIEASAVVGVEPTRMGIGPVSAIQKLLQVTNRDIKSIDLFEINEAFAPQVLSCQKALEIDLNKLNIWGGAIAIGHPLGASGVRLSITLGRQLKHLGLKSGIVSACIGGGQGIAMLISREGECLN